MRVMLAALGLLAARTASAAYCHGAPDPSAKPNLHPIQGKPPVHVRAVSNGLLETAGEGDELISIVHLWGTAYERGVAHGSLMKADVGEFIPAALAFFAEQAALAINGTAKWIPPSVAKWVATVGVNAALDATHELTKKHTGEWFEQEIQGLAKGSGVSVRDIQRLHMVGELTQGHCSMFGA